MLAIPIFLFFKVRRIFDLLVYVQSCSVCVCICVCMGMWNVGGGGGGGGGGCYMYMRVCGYIEASSELNILS